MPILNVPVINKPLIIWYVEHDLVMHGYWAMKMRFYSLYLSFISISYTDFMMPLFLEESKDSRNL